jgi:hypothetical protein
MRPTVFIHTNHKQIAGAIVAEHSLVRNSKNADKFDIRVIHTEDHPLLREREGQRYLRDGVKRVWRYEDLQSFTTLRFRPPELMGYEGRAVVIDPDVFGPPSCAGRAPAARNGGATWPAASCCSTAPSSPTGAGRRISTRCSTSRGITWTG